MPKISLLFATLAAILIVAPATLSATEPDAERVNIQSAEWQEHWEPCFSDRPADRVASLRGWNTYIELFEELEKRFLAATVDDAEDGSQLAASIVLELGAIWKNPKIGGALDDFESVANHGCGPAQAMTAMIYGNIYRSRGVDGPDWLKWMMLAELSGYARARDALKNEIWKYSAEEIAEARAWVDAWRPSD
ncbi:MAG: hypothetical protein HOI02_00015 [Rhodospirillaceae bacterium]|nr:hypothetical protein [Rhodospirillaceae bacterium]